MAIGFNIQNKEIDGKTFALLRTNPKLTSNIKLIVDSAGDIFLGSFKSNKLLSQVSYQKFNLSESGIYSKDVSSFYKGLSKSDAYHVWRKYSDLTSYSDYEYQYENQYNYGASFNATKLYDEQYKILAPIWIDRKIPSKFVVYRIDSVDYDYDYSETPLAQNSRILDLLNKATIVKTFDLTKRTKIGKYLHNHALDASMPSSPINFNYAQDGATEFRGIDIIKGGFASKKEFLFNDYIQSDNLEIFSNKLITDGFERHGIISANLINIEFMFDDTNAEDYNIYRYFGLYVDEYEEGKFEVNNVSSSGLVSIEESSIRVNYDLEGTGLTPVDMLPTHTDLDLPILSYVKSGLNEYYHVTNEIGFLPKGKLKINVDEIPVLKGFIKTNNLIQALSTKPSNRGFVKLTITDVPAHNDKLLVADKSELDCAQYDITQYICIADSSLDAGTTSGNRFSNKGSLQQIAYAISNVIALYKTYVYNNSIVIEDYTGGSSRSRMSVGILNSNLNDFVTVTNGKEDPIEISGGNYYYNDKVIQSTHSLVLDWNLYTSVGGSNKGCSFLIDQTELGEVSVGEYVKVKDLNKFSRIIEIVQDHYDSTKYRIVINDPIVISNDNTIQPYVNQSPSFGKFSAYSLKDLDFDFYSNDNSDLGELKYESFRERQVSLSGAAETTVGNIKNVGSLQVWDIDVTSNIFVGDFLKSTIQGEFSKITKVEWLPQSLITSIEVDGPISQDYEIASNPTSIPVYIGVKYNTLTPLLEQETIEDNPVEITINSEYDRLSENMLKETALESRIVPTIMKFALKDATNARNKPYILNVNEAFGIDNLSPNIEIESGRNSDYFNMEHFHINFIPNSFYENNTITGLTSYLDFNNIDGSGTGISEEKLKSVDVDYFSLYFKWNGAYNNDSDMWVDDKFHDMFTKFSGGSNELEPSTVFRGLRYIYKKRKEYDKKAPTEFIKTTEVNDYKFGVVLNYTVSESNSINYKVIKNDVFKFICIVIDLKVVYNSISISGLTRSLMYSLVDIADSNGNVLNTKIPFNLNLALTNWNAPSLDSQGTPYYSVFSSQFVNDPKFTEYVTKVKDDNYSWIFFTGGQSQWAMKVERVISDGEIAVSGKPISFDGGNTYPLSGGTPLYGSIEIDDLTLYSLPPETEFYYWKGGEFGWKSLLEETVSYKFAKRFNEFNSVEYVTINEDGESYDRFVIEVQDGVQVVKPSVLTTSADGDRPKSYKLTPGEIGRTTKLREDGGYFTILRRMNGEYLPLFRDVVSFSNIYNSQSVYIPNVGSKQIDPENIRENLIFNKFRNLGIAFSSYKSAEENYGIIKNAFFHKVNDENSKNLLKLSESSDKLPLYPHIGEVAIDKKDINVFKSKYASDYFTKSISGGRKEDVHGTLSPVENKSYMVSTVMKVKDVYDLTNFKSNKEVSLDSLDSIRANKLNTRDIHWIETDTEIIADFYLPKSILGELEEDNIYGKFVKYIKAEYSYADKTSLYDDLEKYVYSNIVNRFIVNSVNVYAIYGKNITTDFTSVSDPAQLLDDGYVQQSNFDIQGYQNDALSFRLVFNKKLGYNYNLKVHVKIQA